jgi:biotin carboxyl carrier protein
VSGAGLPQRGEVTELLAEDASQVQFGQVLFRIKPIV